MACVGKWHAYNVEYGRDILLEPASPHRFNDRRFCIIGHVASLVILKPFSAE
jgi:hypothetical protein